MPGGGTVDCHLDKLVVRGALLRLREMVELSQVLHSRWRNTNEKKVWISRNEENEMRHKYMVREKNIKYEKIKACVQTSTESIAKSCNY